MELRKYLISIADEDFRAFQQKLIPACNGILGIRVPELRRIAKEISKGDWRSFLETAECEYMEEIMLKGMTIGFIKNDVQLILQYTEDFISLIDNWAVCDIFCGGLKAADKYRELFWNFIQPYLRSKEEYEVRFAVVMILSHFICEEYIDKAIKSLDSVNHDGYYAKMAVAWAVSVCFVKFPEKTMAYLRNNSLDDETYNKAIQKIIESRRVDPETKDLLRKMKRRK